MNFLQQLRQLDFNDIGRWPFMFRALGVLIVFLFVTILLVWYFVWGSNGNRPELLKARAEQVSLWNTFDEKQRKAANLEAYRQQLSRFVYQTGMFMRPVFTAAKAVAKAADLKRQGR